MTHKLPHLHPLFVSKLPADKIISNNSRSVEHAAYSWAQPTATKSPTLICANHELAQQLGFSVESLNSPSFVELVTGQHLATTIKPYAMNYGGHQFGQWAGQLGDGRAINLGQYCTTEGNVTLQLKGAGKTPYSRRADGMAVLRSSIREYLCSEAMYHLGIPTTRALSLTLTGEQVIRDKLYDGQPGYEPCAIVSRISPSFLRFGSIQLPASRGDIELLKQTVEYSIRHDYSQLVPENDLIDKQTYLAWFALISQRTATLIVNWMRVGFVHGVLNTDNMSLIGETIDYGPYGWVDNFDLNWTPNTSDAAEKRYRFGQQAYIGQWNLFQLANAIYPLINEEQALQNILSEYNQYYQQQWLNMMRGKLGLSKTEAKGDLILFTNLESLLSSVETDMTLFYRLLANWDSSTDSNNTEQLVTHFKECFYHLSELDNGYLLSLSLWIAAYQKRLFSENISDPQRKILMDKVNPCYILRNFQVQAAIERAESGDYSQIQILQTLIKNPYQQQTKYNEFELKRPHWAKDKFGCSALSCSS